MQIEDFSNGFDTLLNSYSRKGQFGDSHPDIRLDEWEKSLFLTDAQDDVVIGLYSGKNPYGESFESSEEMRRYLSPLVEDAALEPMLNSGGRPLGVAGKDSYFFTLPEDLWYLTYESVNVNYGSDGKCGKSGNLEVYPVRQDEYHRIKKNPFRGANERRALRLDLADGVVEIVSNYDVDTYYVRYLRRPKPIILVNLEGEAEIRGEHEVMGCELHEALHQKILDRAVMLALQSKGAIKSQDTGQK